MKKIKLPMFSIAFGIIMILGLIGIGIMHEQVHVQIYSGYGVESRVEYFSHFPDFVTISDGCPKEYFDSCRLAHNINEAITYPIQIIYVVISLGLFILILLSELKLELEQQDIIIEEKKNGN